MTAVVQRAELAGKEVKPLIVPTTTRSMPSSALRANSRSRSWSSAAPTSTVPDDYLEQIAFFWINLHEGPPVPLTVRILDRERDLRFDLAGGSRIPSPEEHKAGPSLSCARLDWESPAFWSSTTAAPRGAACFGTC